METRGKRGGRGFEPPEGPAASADSPMPAVEVEATAGAPPTAAVSPATAPSVASPVPQPLPQLPGPPPSRMAAGFEQDALAALTESQAALARGLEALSNQVARFARSEIDAVARTASRMLNVRTLSDAIEVNAGYARSSFDAWLEASAKLSELGVKYAAEASHPLLSHFNKSWMKAARYAS
jgi:hypothetical protein